jgi:hypothetical protein
MPDRRLIANLPRYLRLFAPFEAQTALTGDDD